MARAIEQLKQAMEACELGALTLPDQIDVLMDAGKAVLQEVSTLTPQNEPLTIEQLREMDGEPVWIKRLKGLSVCDTGTCRDGVCEIPGVEQEEDDYVE